MRIPSMRSSKLSGPHHAKFILPPVQVQAWTPGHRIGPGRGDRLPVWRDGKKPSTARVPHTEHPRRGGAGLYQTPINKLLVKTQKDRGPKALGSRGSRAG